MLRVTALPQSVRDELAQAAIDYVDASRQTWGACYGTNETGVLDRDAARESVRDRLFFAVDRAHARRLDTRKVK